LPGLTIYRSSAGSGKTYTLVKEYLLIALQYPLQFSRILAITFTNKATAEMKSRIISALDELSSGKNSALQNELQENLQDINIAEQAQTVLTNILHHYGNFSVSTIDSFFNDIVKSLAHELKLSLRFEIELDTDKILAEARDSLLAQAGSDKQLTEWLEEFLKFQLDNDKGWNIREGLIKVARKLFDEEYEVESFELTADQFKKISSELYRIKTTFESAMQRYGSDLIQTIRKNGFGVDDFAYGTSGVAGYLLKISQKIKKTEDYVAGTRVINAVNDPDKWLSKQQLSNSLLREFIHSTLQPELISLYNYTTENFRIYNSAVEALKRIYMVGILSRLNEEIKKYRDEHNVITLNDANRIVRTSVSSADAPLIFEKTGSFFQHYLVDEFQDTSTVQWENIRPLIAEALSNNKSALIVGDIKQSIYRWRGGNMDLLHTVAEKQLSGQNAIISSKVLNTNYRSTKEIIDFNNEFFTLAAEWLQQNGPGELKIIKEAYAATQLHQLSPERTLPDGYIKINYYEKEKGETSVSETSWKKRSLTDMLSAIRELESKGFSLGDITILVRSNFQGNEAASFLYENGIHNIISTDSLLISTAPQVLFIINCLSLLHDTKNVVIRKEVEWFLFLQHEKRGAITHSIFHAEQKENEIALAVSKFIKRFASVSIMPVDDLVTLIIAHFNLNKKPDAYIQRLQDLIAEYKENNAGDIASFVNWWNTDSAAANCSIVMPESQAAIRIMTIHKSKGLQFPVVILPFADWDLQPRPGEILWAKADAVYPFDELDYWPVSSSPQLEKTVFSEAYAESLNNSYIDNLNLLYVAFTRAVHHLYINVLRKDPASTGKSVSVSTLIEQVAVKMNLDEGDNTLSKGRPVFITRKSSDKAASLFHPENRTLTSYPVSNWQERMLLKTETKFTSEAIESGLITHEALSFIFEEKDTEAALAKIRNIYNLTAGEAESIRNTLTSLLAECRPEHWFDGTYSIFTERDFLSQEGALLRPDRIMIKDKKAIIVDYKTGEESASHRKQAEEYKKLLIDCGFEEAECWLLYTTSGQRIKVS
jgi:ATP-dependent helicase/nuclease subunit A